MKQKLSLKQASSLLRSIATGRMTDLPAIQKACRNVNELLVWLDHVENVNLDIAADKPLAVHPKAAALAAPPAVPAKRKPGRPRKIALPNPEGGIL